MAYELNIMVTYTRIESNGARSFPPVAGHDDDAGHRGASVCAIAARIWIAARRISCAFDGIGSLQRAGARGAGDLQEATFWRAEKEVAAIRRIGCKLVNWKEPEYPQNLLLIYDPQ
jgi:hypothetical protein